MHTVNDDDDDDNMKATTVALLDETTVDFFSEFGVQLLQSLKMTARKP